MNATNSDISQGAFPESRPGTSYFNRIDERFPTHVNKEPTRGEKNLRSYRRRGAPYVVVPPD